MNPSSSAPTTIRIHHELSRPSKRIAAWIVPKISTPSSVPATWPRPYGFYPGDYGSNLPGDYPRNLFHFDAGGFTSLVVSVAGLAAGTVLILNQLLIPGWFCLGLAALAAVSLLWRR